MKVLIRSKSNGLYLAEREDHHEEWVNPIGEAHDFGGAVNAIAFVVAHYLRDIELVHAFPDAQYNFSLPLS